MPGKTLLLTALFGCALLQSSMAQRQMEQLDRGVVAVKQTNGAVFVGWRMLGTDPDNVTFNLYRKSGNAAPAKINSGPITNMTMCSPDRLEPTNPMRWSRS